MTAQGIEARSDTTRSGVAEGKSPVVADHAPNFGLTIPHNPLSVQLSEAVVIGLLPVCILAFCTRPTAAVGSASIHKPYGPASSVSEPHGVHAQGIKP